MQLFVCFLLLAATSVSAFNEGIFTDGRQCHHQPNATDDLAFVNPFPAFLDEGEYPAPVIMTMEGRYQIVTCCATGFDSIKWYFNGKLITYDDQRFEIEERQQVLHWFKPGPAEQNSLRCELVKNETTKLDQLMEVHVIPDCQVPKPYYTIIPEDKCASKGDTVTFTCEVHFGVNECVEPFFKDVLFMDDNDNYVKPLEAPYENVKYQTYKADDQATSIFANITFYNITEAQLATTYYCTPQKHEYMKADFKFTGPCEEKITYLVETTQAFQSDVALQAAIPLVVAGCVTILIIALIYSFRKALTHMWSTRINPTKKGSCTYDAYVVCSKSAYDQTFLAEQLLPPLEKFYRLCVPDRDFRIGSVIPAEMSEYVKRCKRVLVVSSTNLLQTDYCDLSLSVGIANNIPLIFIKPNNQSEGSESFHKLLADKPELSAAYLVSSQLQFPEKVTESAMEKFYNGLYHEMPLSTMAKVEDLMLKEELMV